MASAKSRNEGLYARLDPDEREIRLLTVDPSHDSNDPISLQMTSYSLNCEGLQYRALSYTWGNPSPKSIRKNPWMSHHIPSFDYNDRVIHVNNFELTVTANLFFFLRQFRKRGTKQSPLWVDAICLNQEDKTEVADQVRMMSDIYSNSIEVLVWLGDEEGETDSGMAVELVKTVYNLFEEFVENDENNEAAATFSEIESQITVVEDAMGFTENTLEKFWHNIVRLQTMFLCQIDLFSLRARCDRRAWAAVGNLTKRSWFRRLWTFQEKSIGKSATLMIGEDSISWATFHAVMSLLHLHDNMDGRRQTMLDYEPARYFRDTMPISSTKPYCLTLQHALLDVVRCARSRECSDPRDKIFGVLGTASKTDSGYAHFLPLVNYDTSTAQSIYTEFARFYIEDQNDLTVLSSCTSYPAGMRNLPSWAPDWTTIQFENPLQHHFYCAANGFLSSARYNLARNEIQISGIAIDHCHILAPLGHPYIYPDTETTTEDAQRVVNLFRNLYEHGCSLNSSKELEGSWIDLSKAIDWEAPYKGEQNAQICAEVYWRTLFVDVDPRGFKKTLAGSFTEPLYFRMPNEVSVRDLIDIWFKLKPLPETFEPNIESTETRHARFCQLLEPRLLTVTQGRHFYVTKKGYMGLATHNAQPGDLVVVLLGSNIPFLLRRVEQHYIVIGETYIHGFMYGEAMNLITTGGRVVDFNLR